MESIIESPEGRKAGGPRDGHDRHFGLHNQLAREIEPVVVGDSLGCLTDFFFKESSQMPRAQTQPFGEPVFVCLMELVSGDELERSLNDGLLAPPSWRQGSALGAASQTWSISRQFRRSGVGEELDVFALRSRRTNWPAVNTRGLDRNEKFTVEPVVSRQHGFVKVGHHKSSIGVNDAGAQDARSPFSDIILALSRGTIRQPVERKFMATHNVPSFYSSRYRLLRSVTRRTEPSSRRPGTSAVRSLRPMALFKMAIGTIRFGNERRRKWPFLVKATSAQTPSATYDTEGNKKELRLYQEKIDISTLLKMRSG
ncbi:MAG TPA: hypothetical protein VIH18_15665 [Candidatus Binatia bacterium]